MDVSKILLCSSKFPWEGHKFSFVFIDNLGKRAKKKKVLQPCTRTNTWLSCDSLLDYLL